MSDLKTSFINNYPDVKINLLKIKSLKSFKEVLPNVINGINVSAVITAENISEHDFVAIASSASKYKSVSL